MFGVERLVDSVRELHILSGKIKYLEVRNIETCFFKGYHIIDITMPKMYGTAELHLAPSKGMPVYSFNSIAGLFEAFQYCTFIQVQI